MNESTTNIGVDLQTHQEASEQARLVADSLHERELKRAEERGRREQDIDGRLNAHEERLNAINGSVARTGNLLTEIKSDIQKISISKQAILAMQARQIALIGCLGGIVYVILVATGHA